MRKFERLLRRREVESRTGRSCSSIYAGIAAGTFPAPVTLGSKSVAWLESEIDTYIQRRIAERDKRLGGSRSKGSKASTKEAAQ